MVLAMCPSDNCACSKDQEPAAIGQEQADRRIPDDAECPHLTRLFSECFQDKPLVNPLCGGCRLRQETAEFLDAFTCFSPLSSESLPQPHPACPS